MRLLKSKEDIAFEAGLAAKTAMRNLSSVGWSDQSSYSFMGQLLEIISKAVEGGVYKALQEMYTEEDFQRDLTLK